MAQVFSCEFCDIFKDTSGDCFCPYSTAPAPEKVHDEGNNVLRVDVYVVKLFQVVSLVKNLLLFLE